MPETPAAQSGYWTRRSVLAVVLAGLVVGGVTVAAVTLAESSTEPEAIAAAEPAVSSVSTDPAVETCVQNVMDPIRDGYLDYGGAMTSVSAVMRVYGTNSAAYQAFMKIAPEFDTFALANGYATANALYSRRAWTACRSAITGTGEMRGAVPTESGVDTVIETETETETETMTETVVPPPSMSDDDCTRTGAQLLQNVIDDVMTVGDAQGQLPVPLQAEDLQTYVDGYHGYLDDGLTRQAAIDEMSGMLTQACG